MRIPRHIRMLALSLLFLAAHVSAAPRLDLKIRRLLAQSPAARGGFAGILVVDDKNRRIFSLNADRLFVPASNTKLFSMALALERLGPDKRFETRVELRPNGRGGSDLVLIGTGDANLSGRVLPYRYQSQPGPALSAIDDLATQAADRLASQGTHEIQGDIIGDDTTFLYEPFAPSWAVEDLAGDDGAPVSALVVNDNCFYLRINPAIGTPASGTSIPPQIVFDPPIAVYSLQVNLTAGVQFPATGIRIDRIPGDPDLRISGNLPTGSPPISLHLAVDDPARFAALALRYSLEQHGVHVTGQARALHRFEGFPFDPPVPGTLVARRQSPPLLSDMEVIGKTSHNLHADLLLFDVAGSREAGLVEMGRFLTEAGITPDHYRFYDGSGLSRMNLVTPEAVVKLLAYMSHSIYAAQWFGTLPVSGVDGSLATRLDKPRFKGRVRAKTGTLNHVSALAGYVDTRRGRRLTFSIFLNNTLAGTDARQELIDKICAELLNY